MQLNLTMTLRKIANLHAHSQKESIVGALAVQQQRILPHSQRSNWIIFDARCSCKGEACHCHLLQSAEPSLSRRQTTKFSNRTRIKGPLSEIVKCIFIVFCRVHQTLTYKNIYTCIIIATDLTRGCCSTRRALLCCCPRLLHAVHYANGARLCLGLRHAHAPPHFDSSVITI